MPSLMYLRITTAVLIRTSKILLAISVNLLILAFRVMSFFYGLNFIFATPANLTFSEILL